jgi:DNA-binding CsgD family transcriptional regulator
MPRRGPRGPNVPKGHLTAAEKAALIARYGGPPYSIEGALKKIGKSDKTLQSQLDSCRRKLGAKNRDHLFVLALRLGYIKPIHQHELFGDEYELEPDPDDPVAPSVAPSAPEPKSSSSSFADTTFHSLRGSYE